MPRVTKITQQQKRRDRYSIYINDQYSFSLSENQLAEARLKVGQELTPTELEEYQQESDVGKAIAKVYRLLAARDRSTSEVTLYLQRKGYGEEEITAVTRQLEEQKLLNDNLFAKNWVEGRRSGKAKSRLQLRKELAVKGINKEIIEEALADYGSETQAIIEMVEKRNLRQKYPEQQKLLRYLYTQGFTIDDIRQALEL
ncbi:MAG TPA: RecX family transcriptional regulator [Candidatus Dormibacteraeota bacterium]|nr:RecX family transcriptional regulator [Candidatus Dormibacteraeota bacterium]